MSTRAKTPARRGYHHGNLRRALLDAALAIIRRDSAEGLTLRGVARAAGVSAAAPYRHFADRNALLAAVAEEGFRMMAVGMRQSAEAHGDDAVRRLRASGLAYIAFARAHPEHFRVMFGSYVADRAKYPGLRQAASESFALLEGRIADAQKAGFIVAGDVRSLAIATWSMTHGFASLLVNRQLEAHGGDVDPEELASRVTAALFLGIGRRPG